MRRLFLQILNWPRKQKCPKNYMGHAFLQPSDIKIKELIFPHLQFFFVINYQSLQRHLESMVRKAALFALIIAEVASIKLFMIGGALQDHQTDIFIHIGEAAEKTLFPDSCDSDWQTTKCAKVAVITSAAQSEDQGNQAYLIDQPDSACYQRLFEMNGFSPKHISVHRDNYQRATNMDTMQGKRNLEILRQADIYFFNGGDQARHSRCWMNDDGSFNEMMKLIRNRVLREEVVLSGSSAGAMIMCSPIYGEGISYGHLYYAASIGLAQKKISDGEFYGNELYDTRQGLESLQYRDNGGIMDGFNFVPFLVDSHVNTQGRLGRMVPGMIQTKKELGIGLEQSTALYFHDDKGTVYGKTGVFIVDLSQAIKTTKQYFGARNIIVSYLTSGDSYNFKTKKITPDPSKTRIENPTYIGHSDSDDIFKAYQITRIYTRLLDQTSPYNIGKSQIPTGYPSNAPVFRLTFEKTSETSSYWSQTQKKYTGVNVSVHYAYE